MSFDIICSNCGAPSGPSVGVCPFCKSVMAEAPKNPGSATLTQLKKFFQEGSVENALLLAKQIDSTKKMQENINFIILYVQILLETEGPSGLIRSLITRGLMLSPENSVLMDYLDIIEARVMLSHGINDPGEMSLRNVLRRSPENVHALFLLGSHLYWVDKQIQMALPLLQKCIQLRPNFLRANACLAAIYNEMGAKQQAIMLFKKCASLEKSKEMKKYFLDFVK